MARKSERLSSSMKALPTHKRAASATVTPVAGAKRTKTKKATPTKSQYFKDGDDSNDLEQNDEANLEVDSVDQASTVDEDASEFGDEMDEDSVDVSDAEDDEDDYDSEEAPKRRQKSTSRKASTTTVMAKVKGGELWRPGVKTGLGPGTQVIIKKPKARAAGKTPYTDDTIHRNTLLFLQDLKTNNDRQWLKSKFAIPLQTLREQTSPHY